MGLHVGDRHRCGHLEREKKKKRKKKKKKNCRSQREREKEGDRFCKEEELSVLSFTCKVCGTNECMPRVLFFLKKKNKKIISALH